MDNRDKPREEEDEAQSGLPWLNERVSSNARRPVAEAGRQFVRERFIRPVAVFVDTEASGGIVLLAAAFAALIWQTPPGMSAISISGTPTFRWTSTWFGSIRALAMR